MNRKMTRATAPTVAQKHSTHASYQSTVRQANTINEILARLLFGLESPHVTSSEQSTILGLIDNLVRLKVDAGLLGGNR